MFEQVSKGLHDWCYGETECDLVYKSEPGPGIGDAGRYGEFGYGGHKLRGWLESVGGNRESTEVCGVLSKVELFGIEDDAIVRA